MSLQNLKQISKLTIELCVLLIYIYNIVAKFLLKLLEYVKSALQNFMFYFL
jgi:hypothetical protein